MVAVRKDLVHSDDNLPPEGAGFSDGACKAASSAAADESVPPLLGTDRSDKDLHVGPELAAPRF